MTKVNSAIRGLGEILWNNEHVKVIHVVDVAHDCRANKNRAKQLLYGRWNGDTIVMVRYAHPEPMSGSLEYVFALAELQGEGGLNSNRAFWFEYFARAFGLATKQLQDLIWKEAPFHIS